MSVLLCHYSLSNPRARTPISRALVEQPLPVTPAAKWRASARKSNARSAARPATGVQIPENFEEWIRKGNLPPELLELQRKLFALLLRVDRALAACEEAASRKGGGEGTSG